MTAEDDRALFADLYPRLRAYAAVVVPAEDDPDDLVQIFDAQVLNVGFDQLMVSLAGSQRRLDDFEALVSRFGILEIQRTGKIALSELAKVDPEG